VGGGASAIRQWRLPQLAATAWSLILQQEAAASNRAPAEVLIQNKRSTFQNYKTIDSEIFRLTVKIKDLLHGLMADLELVS
jgi:hypothetical protein